MSPKPSERQRARCNVASDGRVALELTLLETWKRTHAKREGVEAATATALVVFSGMWASSTRIAPPKASPLAQCRGGQASVQGLRPRTRGAPHQLVVWSPSRDRLVFTTGELRCCLAQGRG